MAYAEAKIVLSTKKFQILLIQGNKTKYNLFQMEKWGGMIWVMRNQ